MVKINIAGTIYEYPNVGENPNWGREATEVIIALADALNSLITDGDILLSKAAIQNDISVFTIINGLLFDSNKTSSAITNYTISRQTTDEYKKEVGKIFLSYDYDSLEWIMSRQIDSGDAGIIFEVDAGGQIFYKTTEMVGINHTGVISFSAKTTPK